MQRLRVDYRPAASGDLRTIFEYIFDLTRSAVTAERFTTSIYERCERIGHAPYSGRSRDDLAAGLRTIPFKKSTVIAYTIIDDCVWITNVFYGGRDYEALYRGTPPEEGS